MTTLRVDPDGCGPFLLGTIGFLLIPLGGIALFTTPAWPGVILLVIGLISSTISAYRFKEGRPIEGGAIRSPAEARRLFLWLTYSLAAVFVFAFLKIDVLFRIALASTLIFFAGVLVIAVAAWVQRIQGLVKRDGRNE